MMDYVDSRCDFKTANLESQECCRNGPWYLYSYVIQSYYIDLVPVLSLEHTRGQYSNTRARAHEECMIIQAFRHDCTYYLYSVTWKVVQYEWHFRIHMLHMDSLSVHVMRWRTFIAFYSPSHHKHPFAAMTNFFEGIELCRWHIPPEYIIRAYSEYLLEILYNNTDDTSPRTN